MYMYFRPNLEERVPDFGHGSLAVMVGHVGNLAVMFGHVGNLAVMVSHVGSRLRRLVMV